MVLALPSHVCFKLSSNLPYALRSAAILAALTVAGLPMSAQAASVTLDQIFEVTNASADRKISDLTGKQIFDGTDFQSLSLEDDGSTPGRASTFGSVDPVTGELKVRASVRPDGLSNTGDILERDKASAASFASLTETFTIGGTQNGTFFTSFTYDGSFGDALYADVTASIEIFNLSLFTDDPDFNEDLELGGSLDRRYVIGTHQFDDPIVDVRPGDDDVLETLDATVNVAPGDVIEVIWTLNVTAGAGLGFTLGGSDVPLEPAVQTIDFSNTGRASYSSSGVTATPSNALTLSNTMAPVPVPGSLPLMVSSLAIAGVLVRRAGRKA